MKVIGLNNKEYSWNPHINNREGNKSQYHLKAKELLNEIFPFEHIYEEVELPGSKSSLGKTLVADFCIPAEKLIIEVHGQQHYEYVSFFHPTKMDFIRGLVRDRNKKEWCKLNSVQLVVLKYSENIDEWRRKIVTRKNCKY